MQCKVILNPVAANGTAKKFHAMILSLLQNHGLQADSVVTHKAGHAEELAVEAVKDGFDYIVAVGGDGTIHHVANGILSSDGESTLGIIPLGTCNDFIKSLQIPNNIEGACQVLAGGQIKRYDIGKVDGRFFVNAAGFGFDAEVVKELRKSSVPGRMAYMATVLKHITRYKPSACRIKVNGVEEEQDVFMLTVANGSHYGGQFHIAPRAQVEDGQLDIILVKNASILRRLSILPHFIKGTHLDKPEVMFFRATQFEVTTNDSVTLQIEGELYESKSNRIEFTLLPKRLKIKVP